MDYGLDQLKEFFWMTLGSDEENKENSKLFDTHRKYGACVVAS